MKTLLLGPLRNPAERTRLARLEAADAHPRVLLFEERLSADVLDPRVADLLPGTRKLRRRLPVWVRQVVEVYARRREYDAIVSWGERGSLLLALLLMLSASRTPHVALLYWVSPKKKALLLRLVQSHIDRIVTWSSVQREIAIRRLGVPAAKITLTHHPVDHRFWRPMGAATDVICAAGNEMRDYATLIEAMRGVDINCEIAVRELPPGRSRKLTSLRAIGERGPLPPNVTVDSKTPPELRHLYARSRFVVVPLLPTDTDNGVTTILEAMAMGKAVICSRVQGQVDVIVEHQTGLFVPQGDPGALRQAIQFLWEHPEVADRMGQAGRKRVEERHTLDRFVETVRCIVDDVIAQTQTHLVPEGQDNNPITNRGTSPYSSR